MPKLRKPSAEASRLCSTLQPNTENPRRSSGCPTGTSRCSISPLPRRTSWMKPSGSSGITAPPGSSMSTAPWGTPGAPASWPPTCWPRASLGRSPRRWSTSARPGRRSSCDPNCFTCSALTRSMDAHSSSRLVASSASLLAAAAGLLAGAQARWLGCRPDLRQRVYFSNHTSHLDFVVLWGALPRKLRAFTRPVAARDYWGTGTLRCYLATQVFNAVLLERANLDDVGRRQQVDLLLEALGECYSLILFPEGTRGTGREIAPFKSGLYHLALKRPDVELVPVYLENLHRILPKGALLPVPLLSSASFGSPIRVLPGEEKESFLERAREAVRALRPA